MSIRLSVIIPSYRDPLMVPTVRSLLDTSELGDALEILVVLDGYWPDFEIVSDKRVRYPHLGRNRGMREAINAGVALARGEFIMRVDEHQMFSQGCDRILCDACQDNWIVTPRRYALDPVKWEVMPDVAPVDHMTLEIRGQGPGRKFTGVARPGDDSQPIEESWAMQGSCWLMPRALWQTVGPLQTEGYGPHYQDSHEMTFRLWQVGGHLMVVKDAWHAHKHRSFPRTHNNGTAENPANSEQSWAYALSQWEGYYHREVEGRCR